MREIKALPLDDTKNVIYNICLESIATVNSFIDDNGHNHFNSMVRHILKYIDEEIIGINEAVQICVNGKMIKSIGAYSRNKFRNEMRDKLRIPLSKFKEDKSNG